MGFSCFPARLQRLSFIFSEVKLWLLPDPTTPEEKPSYFTVGRFCTWSWKGVIIIIIFLQYSCSQSWRGTRRADRAAPLLFTLLSDFTAFIVPSYFGLPAVLPLSPGVLQRLCLLLVHLNIVHALLVQQRLLETKTYPMNMNAFINVFFHLYYISNLFLSRLNQIRIIHTHHSISCPCVILTLTFWTGEGEAELKSSDR